MRQKILKIVTLVFALVTFAGYIRPASAETLPPRLKIYSSVSVRVDSVPKNQLYSFVTNINNDALWYPGIISTAVIHTGPNGSLVGTQYSQVAAVNESLTTTTIIDVLSAKKNTYYLIKGDGDFADYTALYTFTAASNGGGVFTLNSVYDAPGLTQETFEQYITYALSGLLRYYNSTGDVHVNFIYVQE
jgi:hypothetical protein